MTKSAPPLEGIPLGATIHVYNLEETLTALREIVETAHPEGPAFKYTPPDGVGGYCVYYVRKDDKWVPDCLIGRLFDQLNLTDDSGKNFREMCTTGDRAEYWNGEGISHWSFQPFLTANFTRTARDLITRVQVKQDGAGNSWGWALQAGYQSIPTDDPEWVSWDGQFKGFEGWSADGINAMSTLDKVE